jgi:hypothetical protein
MKILSRYYFSSCQLHKLWPATITSPTLLCLFIVNEQSTHLPSRQVLRHLCRSLCRSARTFEHRNKLQVLRQNVPALNRQPTNSDKSINYFSSLSADLIAPRIFIAAKDNCKASSANDWVCHAQTAHRALLARKTQNPALRRSSREEATSQDAAMVTTMAGH